MNVSLSNVQLDSLASQLPILNGFYVANLSEFADVADSTKNENSTESNLIRAAMLPVEDGAFFLKTSANNTTIAQLEGDLRSIVQSFHTDVH